MTTADAAPVFSLTFIIFEALKLSLAVLSYRP